MNNVFTQKGEAWEEKRLGDICDFSSGGTPSKKNDLYWQNGDIPWVSGKDMKTERMTDAILHISNLAVEESATRLAPIGSLLILVRGMGLANGIPVAEVMLPCTFNQDIKCLTPAKYLLARFLLLSLKNTFKVTNGILDRAAHGTLKIAMNDLKDIKVSFPSYEDQEKIVAQADSISMNVITLQSIYQQKLNSLHELKQSILQKAFSGRLN